MPIKEQEIKTLSDYISFITSLKCDHEKLWFRGHASSEYKLMPTVYRPPYDWKKESVLLHQFKARAVRFLDSLPNNDEEWLFIMQHHSTPTRLLDWSESALVALSFAVQFRRKEHEAKDAVVWCLDPIKLNSKIRSAELEDEPIPNICESEFLKKMYFTSIMQPEFPVAIIGPQNTERIVAQKGVFTLFPKKESFEMETVDKSEEFLVKIAIPKENIDSIKKELYFIGVTESSLFPELDSISKELKRNYEGEE